MPGLGSSFHNREKCKSSLYLKIGRAYGLDMKDEEKKLKFNGYIPDLLGKEGLSTQRGNIGRGSGLQGKVVNSACAG